MPRRVVLAAVSASLLLLTTTAGAAAPKRPANFIGSATGSLAPKQKAYRTVEFLLDKHGKATAAQAPFICNGTTIALSSMSAASTLSKSGKLTISYSVTGKGNVYKVSFSVKFSTPKKAQGKITITSPACSGALKFTAKAT